MKLGLITDNLSVIPFSSLKYANPREAFKAMHVKQPAKEGDEA